MRIDTIDTILQLHTLKIIFVLVNDQVKTVVLAYFIFAIV